MKKIQILLLLIFFIFANGCGMLNKDAIEQAISQKVNSLKQTDLSEVEDKVFGQSHTLTFIDNDEGTLDDYPTTVYIHSIIDKLSAIYWGKDKEYIFLTVFRTARVQAAGGSFFGKDIGVTRGMLNMIQDEAELAGLLGHEIGHMALGHGHLFGPVDAIDPWRSQISNGLDVLIKDPSIKAKILDERRQLLNAKYSQDQETAADHFGADLAAKAGYDPYALCDLFARLSAKVQLNPLYRIRKLKGTHPALEVRSESLRVYLHSKGYPQHQGLRSPISYQKGVVGLLYSSKQNDQDKNISQSKQDLKDLYQFDQEIKGLSSYQSMSIDRFVQMMQTISQIAQRVGLHKGDLILPSNATPSNPSTSHFMEEAIDQDSPAWGTSENIKAQIKDEIKTTLADAAQIAVGNIPIVGNAMSLYEVLSGKDFFSEESLSEGQRTISALCVFVGSSHLWKDVAKGIEKEAGKEVLKESSDLERIIKRACEDMEEGSEQEIKYRRAEDVNNELRQQFPNPDEYQNSYLIGEVAVEYKLVKESEFVRVHLKNNRERAWIMKKEDLLGLSPAQIKSKFSLKDEPTHLSDVKLPQNTKIRVGIAAKNRFGEGNGIQYEILDDAEKPWFTNTRLIEGVVK